MTMTPGTPLYHVGCGRRLYDYVPGESMGITCPCGANGPICVPDVNKPEALTSSIPVSLVNSLEAKQPLPHLEYYLGFSTFSCKGKDVWAETLRELGSTPMAECTDSRCQECASRMQARAHGESG